MSEEEEASLAKESQENNASKPALVGIGGWLLIPVTHLVLVCVAVVATILEDLMSRWSMSMVESVTMVATVSLVGATAVAFITKHRAAPWLFVAMQWIQVAMAFYILGTEQPRPDTDTVIMSILFPLIALAYTGYFVRSRRVKQTFVN